MSYETRYAAKMRRLEDERSNTPEAIADRLAIHRANERTRDEVSKRFPKLTEDNIGAALDFQQECFARNVAEERAKDIQIAPEVGE